MTAPPVSCSGAAYSGVKRRFAVAGQRGRLVAGLALEQLGDAEIEQLHLAVRGHQDVRGLEVAVHDQVGVRVGDRRQHVEEQPHARLDAQAPRVAVAVDALAVDVLEHQVRLAVRRDAGVDQLRDVRVAQPGEDAALAPEALLAVAARPGWRSSSLTAASPAKRPSLRSASQTLPMPPWPISRRSV